MSEREDRPRSSAMPTCSCDSRAAARWVVLISEAACEDQEMLVLLPTVLEHWHAVERKEMPYGAGSLDGARRAS